MEPRDAVQARRTLTVPKIIDRFQELYQKNLALNAQHPIAEDFQNGATPGPPALAALAPQPKQPLLAAPGNQGLSGSLMHGAPVAPETANDLNRYLTGEARVDELRSPAAQRVAREHFAANGNPQAQNRRAGVEAGQQVYAQSQGFSSYDELVADAQAKLNATAGTGKPHQQGAAMATGGRVTRKQALATSAGRTKASALARKQNPQGIAYNAMQEASGFEDRQKATAAAQANAAKQAEKDKPSMGDLKAVMPQDDYDLADDADFDKWHSAAMKRWNRVHGIVDPSQPSAAPPTFAGGVAGVQQAWGAVKPQAAPVDPKWEAEVHAAAAQGKLDDQIDALIAQGLEYEEARDIIMAQRGGK